jgi:hypothetical protein
MSDYGWIENDQGLTRVGDAGAEDLPAGGANKNRKVDAQITLPAGNYKLRYKSMTRTRSTTGTVCRPTLIFGELRSIRNE